MSQKSKIRCGGLIYLIRFVLLLAVVSSARAGLVAHWAFDETTGTVAHDSSGSGLDGNLVGGPQWVPGRIDGALQFDGSNDYVQAPHIPFDNRSFTIAMWVNPVLYTDQQIVFSQRQTSATDTDMHFRLGGPGGSAPNPGAVRMGFYANDLDTAAGIIEDNTWYHITFWYDFENQDRRIYVNGVQEAQGASTPYLGTSGDTVIGSWAGSGQWISGIIDDVRIYDHVLSEAEIKDLIPPQLMAYDPDPPDGATGWTSPLLSWQPGDTAKWHDVYLGTDEIAVTNATSSDPMGPAEVYKMRQILAWNMWFEMAGWIADQTYYWRIDQVEADGTTIHVGDVWSFTAAPVTAYNPDPPDGAKNVSTEVDLSWTPGATAFSHDVYFGTDETEVTNGTGGTFKSNQGDAFYDPGTLAKDTKYYWRIDEVEQNITIKHTGDVWSFRTIPDIPITDPDLMGWWKLDDGSGTTAIDWSGHDNHGELRGDPQWVVQGYDGGALDFDGAGDYVYTGKTAATLGVDGANPKTVTAWVYTRAFNNGGIWDVGTRANSEEYCLRTTGTANQWRIQFWGAQGVDDLDFTYPTLNEWVHFGLTYDGARCNAYGNGTYIDSFSPVLNTSNANPFQIGCYGWQNDYFNGIIDDVRLYKKALTQAEVKETMRGDPTLAWNANPANGSTPDIEHAEPVTWSPGDKVAKHDVYFGTDEDAVIDADISDTAGVYRGRIDPNSYTPPEGVQMNQTYYWRIDEFNTDATISEGRIWSYTVADYLIVDDFEDYDDYCNRVFYTYGDGWGHSGDLSCGVAPFGGNGTGSTVGYLQEPYAEQTIVHGGGQSMPFEFLNDGSTGKALYSETERTFEFPQDWTRKGMKSLTLWFQGQPGSVGSFSYDPAGDIYTMTGSGWDIEGTADGFHYAFKQLSGVGSIQAQVLSVQNTNTWAKAGVMIRETLDANSVQTMTVVTPGQGVSFQRRPATGQGTANTTLAGFQAPYWVRISRSGNIFTSEHSADGITWETIGTQDIPMASTVYVGLALTSHNAALTCEATFSDVTITGTVTGQWQSQDIGIVSNVAEQLYVVVEDSTGKSEVANHPDPNAVQSDTWQPWDIPLKQFSDAGVNLQSVKKMYIGLGDRKLPKLGGAGMLYVDDIRLYQLRCMPSLQKPDADFNGNCVVDYSDLEIMANEWLVDADDLQADLDLDNDVDFKDYAGLADTWLDELLWP